MREVFVRLSPRRGNHSTGRKKQHFLRISFVNWLVCLVGIVGVKHPAMARGGEPALAAGPTTAPVAQAETNMTPEELFAMAQDSVFTVVVTGSKPGTMMLGSGFLVSSDGLVVTNFHVIRSGVSAVIKSSDGSRQFDVTGVVATDRLGGGARISIRHIESQMPYASMDSGY